MGDKIKKNTKPVRSKKFTRGALGARVQWNVAAETNKSQKKLKKL